MLALLLLALCCFLVVYALVLVQRTPRELRDPWEFGILSTLAFIQAVTMWLMRYRLAALCWLFMALVDFSYFVVGRTPILEQMPLITILAGIDYLLIMKFRMARENTPLPAPVAGPEISDARPELGTHLETVQPGELNHPSGEAALSEEMEG